MCAHIARTFAGNVFPGDVFFHNDVFSLGNQNNDVAAFKPIFVGDVLTGWQAATKGHMADIGGNVRGGYNPNATEVWQEAHTHTHTHTHTPQTLTLCTYILIHTYFRTL